MLIKFTKTAENARILRGISIKEIEETIQNGIKTMQKDDTVNCSNNHILLSYDLKNNIHLIKMVGVKWLKDYVLFVKEI